MHTEPLEPALPSLLQARSQGKPLLYVASRASKPERPVMWRKLRDEAGWCIASSWIDYTEGSSSLEDLWVRIEHEMALADALMLYVEAEDFPLKGALVEVGMALGRGKPVAVVLGGGLRLDPDTLRPLGSWVAHPACGLHNHVEQAYAWVQARVREAQRRRFQRMRTPA